MARVQIKRVYGKLPDHLAERARKAAEQIERDPSVYHDVNGPMVMGDHWELMFTIGDLRKERLKQGKSLADIEAACGVKASTLSRLESGKMKNPRLATLSRYARALGLRLALKISRPEADSASKKTKRTRAAG